MTITLTGMPDARAEIMRVGKLIKGGQISRAVQVACVGAVKKRFGQHGQKQNRLGAPSTNYWLRAADATKSTRSGGVVNIVVKHRGVALHLYGGTITPKGTSEITGKPIKFLTIPKVPAAHGKTVAMLRALGVNLYPGRGGLLRQTGAQRDYKNDEMYFALAKSATIRADATVIPSVEALAAAAGEAIEEVLAASRNAGPSAGPTLALPWRGGETE